MHRVRVSSDITEAQVTISRHFIKKIYVHDKSHLYRSFYVVKKILTQVINGYSKDSQVVIDITVEDLKMSYKFVVYWARIVSDSIEYSNQLELLAFLKKINSLAGSKLGVNKKWFNNIIY